jgi:hypothetical protein
MKKEDDIKKLFCFIKSGGATFLFLFLYFLLLIIAFLKPPSAYSFIAIIIAYFSIAQIYIEYLQGNLWEYIYEQKDMEAQGLTLDNLRMTHKLTATLGLIDRIIYTICFLLEQYNIIWIWLGLKVASRLIASTGVTGHEYIKEGEKRNAFLIGNAISLSLGIMAGIIIKNYLISNYPNFLTNIKNYLGLLKS